MVLLKCVKFEKYSSKRSFRFHLLLTLFFFLCYASIIIFGFTNVSLQIEQSGFSTADLQNATSRAEIETIVGAWQPVLNSVNLLYFFDYMFILSGVLLFLSLNALLLKNLLGKGKLHLIPKIGLVLTIFSRTFDALENLLTILIYTNPEKFNLILLSMLPKVSVVKWILVSMEYSLMCIGWVIVIILKIRNKKKN